MSKATGGAHKCTSVGITFPRLLVSSTLLFLLFIGLFPMRVANAEPPELTLTVADIDIPMVQGSGCWPLKNGEVLCHDTLAPPELLKSQTPVVVPSGSKVNLHFSYAPLSISASQWMNGTPVKQDLTDHNTTLRLPTEQGTYIYDIFAKWKEGDVSYAFTVQVQ